MTKIEQKLNTGTISMEIDNGDWKPEDLFAFAERKNPKRSFLFVSKILGKHIPVAPSIMRKSYKYLAEKINPINTDGVLFIGMAETAIGLAGGVFEEASKKFTNSMLITTTRHPVDSELIGEFKEEHSHATDHLIYKPINNTESNDFFSKYRTLILIDDESTTGKTFINLIDSLFNKGILSKTNINEIIAVTITDWSRNRLQKLNSTGINITNVSLMTGDWKWQASSSAILPQMPNVNTSSAGEADLSKTQDWGRLGVVKYDNKQWIDKFNAKKNERILVLGTGEFLYPAFKAAEKMEKQGANVVFSSTTRSPISTGLGIKSSLSFTDNYGLSIPNFCYNISHQYFDRIILCTETNPSFIDIELIKNLKTFSNSVEILYYE